MGLHLLSSHDLSVQRNSQGISYIPVFLTSLQEQALYDPEGCISSLSYLCFLVGLQRLSSWCFLSFFLSFAQILTLTLLFAVCPFNSDLQSYGPSYSWFPDILLILLCLLVGDMNELKPSFALDFH